MGTVRKGAGRATAAANTAKHAQRTPLPPKRGVVEDAREAIEATRKPYGEMTVAELREAAKRIGIEAPPARRADLLDAILEAEKASAGRAAKTASKGSSSNGAQTEAGTKSEAKAAAFAVEAANLGWSLETPKTDGDRTEITVRRGEETIDLAWEGGVFQHPCLYSFKGHTIQMRNASAAQKRMSMDPEVSAEERERVAVRKTNAMERKAGVPRQRKLPFDPETATNEEVLSAVQGKMIFWTNGHREVEENDRVPLMKEVRNKANKPKIHEGPHGRILTFAAVGGMFRSVLVSKIVAVK